MPFTTKSASIFPRIQSTKRGEDVFALFPLYNHSSSSPKSLSKKVFESEYESLNVISLFQFLASSKSMIVNSRILALKFNKQLTSPFRTPIKLWFDKLKVCCIFVGS